MELRKLGNSGLEVTKLCLGGNVFGWTIDEKSSFQVLDAYADAGGNFIDTADMYSVWVPGHSGGESETIIGKWMKNKKNRDKMVITTKVGMDLGKGKKGLSKNYIISAVESSLKRLQTDTIDLYLSHKDDEETPLEETLETYGQLIKHGKVRVVGASNYSANRLSKSIDVSHKTTAPAYQVLQPLYNLYDRSEYEKDLKAVCEKWSLGVTPYYALASGFLTGKYRTEKDFSLSPRGSRMQKYLNNKGMKIIESLNQVAKAQKTKPATVALAWLMQQPTITSPIASATSIDQLKDLIAATELKLTQESLQELEMATRW